MTGLRYERVKFSGMSDLVGEFRLRASSIFHNLRACVGSGSTPDIRNDTAKGSMQKYMGGGGRYGEVCQYSQQAVALVRVSPQSACGYSPGVGGMLYLRRAPRSTLQAQAQAKGRVQRACW